MNKLIRGAFGIFALVVAATTGSVQGAEVSSAPFSFGYGWTGPTPASWNTSETTSTNTPTTQGQFNFMAAPVGDGFSSDGVRFPDRVLTDEPGGSIGFSSFLKENFLVPVTANYSGGAPANAAATPNYRLRLEISKISIWGGEHSSSFSSIPLVWDETTPGHLSQSQSLQLPITNDFNEAAAYDQLVWDPADYDVPLAGLNDAFTRTFDILVVDNMGDLRFLDGIEVEGRVKLVYDAIPGAGVDGDYNDDGTVDAADYVVFRKNEGTTNTLENDPNGGTIDQRQYNTFRENFGETEGGSGLGGAVPEPNTGLLLLTALVSLLGRKRFSS